MSKRRWNQLKVGVALSYTVILLQLVVALLYTPFMLRLLGQVEYGLYSLVVSPRQFLGSTFVWL